MACKSVLVSVILFAIVSAVLCRPRDSTVVHGQDTIQVNSAESHAFAKEVSSTPDNQDTIQVNSAESHAFAKDVTSTPDNQDTIQVNSAESHAFAKEVTSTPDKPAVEEVTIPGRVSCSWEEATEEDVCQEHCAPKGYSYGICVNRTCSCI